MTQVIDKIPVYVKNNGQEVCIGHIKNGTFYKSGVVFRKLDAFSIDERAIDQLVFYSVYRMVIKDKDTGLQYTISLQDFIQNSEKLDLGKWGRQLACPRGCFSVSGNEQLRLTGSKYGPGNAENN
jgi:hypothetical protein